MKNWGHAPLPEIKGHGGVNVAKVMKVWVIISRRSGSHARAPFKKPRILSLLPFIELLFPILSEGLPLSLYGRLFTCAITF